MLTVFTHNDIKKQIQKLFNAGGKYQKAAEKCKALLFDLKESDDVHATLKNYSTTHNGETRIKHCVKYDLPGYCRLVTIQDNGWVILLYLGTHDEVDKWLENNRGLTVAITDPAKGLFDVLVSDDISDPKARINPEPDYSSSFLFEKLKQYWDILVVDIPPFIQKHLKKLDTTCEEEEILEIAAAIERKDKQELVFDVFMAVRGGLVDEAKNRILVFQEKLKLIEDLPIEEVKRVSSNDEYLNLDDLDATDMEILMSNKNWLEWMLFMHPSQRQVVDKDFSGSSRLLGVSGSGKTCVIVRRAIRLAKKYEGQRILILTLNESLAGLINNLVDQLLDCSNEGHLREFIEVKSFWELCRNLIIKYRNRPFDARVLGPKTDRYHESIDEIWDEFYHCENNNNDAAVLFPIHQNLLVRNVYPPVYLKQEFDWIRSFLPRNRWDEYFTVNRDNRAIQFIESDRRLVVKGLKGWERKMEAVGAIDYLGLANELYNYFDRIEASYRCVLVDEIQDFGTLELAIIRKLVERNENDLFLCGDIAQQVYFKHHQIRSAGITILPDAYVKILKNYRNSREILSASYELFRTNIDVENFKSDDFEILNPEFANFSSPKPFLRKGNSLVHEFHSAIEYLNSNLDEKERGCIAICDHSIFEIESLGNEYGFQVLNGSMNISTDKIYLSDLEQTKGFEFDRMIILNVSDKVFPNPVLPEEEIYREVSKFYVAMTRAKKELVVSYSGFLSSLFNNCKQYFTEDDWLKHVQVENSTVQMPKKVKRILSRPQLKKMTAKEFLYHPVSVGISRELQNKLLEKVAGRNVSEKGKKVGWMNMDELVLDVLNGRDKPHYNSLFGPKVFSEMTDLFKKLGLDKLALGLKD